ncbi:MAG TPA: T9SS type A sorting domain-containing protein [Saprospiraceae bacterium]|nr:T9SS type A sorting domain-containing protein [Saprospiraceae bacterium]
MRKIFTALFTLLLLTGGLMAQTRYIDEVFTQVGKLTDQQYAGNVTVVTGVPAADTLLFDLYFPAGDTCSARPLAIVLPTGTFLPRGLFAPTGDKDDYANVQVCERLAKRGYVAASIQYRVGWNPIATSDTVRRSTIINAAYRAVQDLFAFVRYAHVTVENFNNPFNIDTSRIAVFGIGTGGFVGFNAAVLQQNEIYIDKFTNPSGTPMIDTNLVGNLTGEKPGLINIPNHVGYGNKFHFAFGLDGAVGDSSWMEDGLSVPLVAAGTVTHPTTPYGLDVAEPDSIGCDLPVYTGVGTGNFVVNISGSLCMLDKANNLGINNPLRKGDPYNDAVSEEIRSNPNVLRQEHLWGINLPGPQTGPWEYWDTAFWDQVPFPGPGGFSINDVALTTNPDMSLEKANHYIDTALWFFSPRAYAALKLGALICSCNGILPDPELIDDYECHQNTYGAGADRLCVMNNPLRNGNNNSEKSGQYKDFANDPWAALCVLFDSPLSLGANDHFKMQMISPIDGPLLFKLEGGATSPAWEYWTDTHNTFDWENIEVDLSSQAGTDHTRLCLFPNGGVSAPNELTYWLDNLRIETSIGVFTPMVDKLEISPNPVSNILYIRNPQNASQFRIFNSIGQQVMTVKQSGLPIETVMMGDLAPGIYSVGAFNAKGNLIASTSMMKN